MSELDEAAGLLVKQDEAAVEFHQYEVEACERAVAGAEAKIEKLEDRVSDAEADYENALVALEAARARVVAAQAVADARAQELQSSGAANALNASVKAE